MSTDPARIAIRPSGNEHQVCDNERHCRYSFTQGRLIGILGRVKNAWPGRDVLHQQNADRNGRYGITGYPKD